jgi:hypothetical protein
VGKRGPSAEGDTTQSPRCDGNAARRPQRHSGLGHSALEGHDGHAVSAASRIHEEREDETLHPLDEPIGVEGVRVVEHEADLERHAVLADLASQVLDLDSEGASSTSRASRGGADRRVNRDITVMSASAPRP